MMISKLKRAEFPPNYENLENWCFVCKEGGELWICDYPKCEKPYHHHCVGKSKSFLNNSENWHCARHSCLHCKGIPNVTCYTCPNALYDTCLDASKFLRIGDGNGFCEKCTEFVMYIEEQTKGKPRLDGSSKYLHFMEYYMMVKEIHQFTLNDLKAGRKELKRGEKRKSSILDETDASKRLGRVPRMKLDTRRTSENEKKKNDKIRVPALIPQNVKLMYLTRSVIGKLLLQPESFEDRVKGTFVGIELPKKATSNRIDRQLVQVKGITKTCCHDGQISIKLQGKSMPNDISLDMVSDLGFSEILCRDLRQQVENGQIEMPAFEELGQMAKALSEVIVDDFISRETKKLQMKMDRANEMGRREEFLLHEINKKSMQTSTGRLQLIHIYQSVTAEEREVNSNAVTFNDSGVTHPVKEQNSHVVKEKPNTQEKVDDELFSQRSMTYEDPNRFDVMHDEFENYEKKASERIDAKLDSQLTMEDILAKLDSMEQKINRIDQGLELINGRKT